jgi:hypothetical protein
MGLEMSLSLIAITFVYWILHLRSNWKAMRSNYRMTALCINTVKYLIFGLFAFIPQGSIASLGGFVGGVVASIVSYGVLWGDSQPLHGGRKMKYFIPLVTNKKIAASSWYHYLILVVIDAAVLGIIVLPAWLPWLFGTSAPS